MTWHKPELLAPAGRLEKLFVALAYGADAVYVGAPAFGLRKGADNFTLEELEYGVKWASERGKRVYVTLNAMPHIEDMVDLKPFLKKLHQIQPHALIVSDPGVFKMIKEETNLNCHISTQASVTNARTARMWYKAGAKRIVVARELSLEECVQIQKEVPIELEIFVHGAMCASYSGKCTISNYTSGRDSNRGGCVQSCRFRYHLYDAQNTQQEESSSFLMNAKDLSAIALMPQIIQSQVHSLKIEGRMKSNMYVAQSVRFYRKALDQCFEALKEKKPFTWSYEEYEQELSGVSNRGFNQGNLKQRMFEQSISYDSGQYKRSLQYVGTVRHVHDNELFVELKYPVCKGDELRVLGQDGSYIPLLCQELKNISGQVCDKGVANSLVRIPVLGQPVLPHMVLVK